MMRQETYDAVIVGSGATGGWVAKELTEAGLRVAVIEAGRKLNPAEDYTEHKRPFDMPLRGRRYGSQARQAVQPMQRTCYQCDEYTNHLFVDDTEHPYTTPADRPFNWIRGRHVGGKSIMWARQSYRLSDYDLKAASRDGFGVDWPLGYAELAPYYDKVERFIGISGQPENLPQLPDSQFLPPMALTCGEEILKKAIADRFGRVLTIGRAAVLTQPLNGRPACHYCGPCSRGCVTGSYYSSPHSSLPAAAATGRLTLVSDAVVSHVLTGDDGRCTGVYYVDRTSRAHREIQGRLVVLCASTLESTRIMLNSRSSRHPDGLANSSGVLGHYLMDHVMGDSAAGVLPVLRGVSDTRGNRPNGIYIPRFVNIDSTHPSLLRGYGFQGRAGLSNWGHANTISGFGAEFKRRVRDERPWTISLGGFAECLPRHENHCRLDDTRVDAWGIPILHIDAAFGDNERGLIRDAADTAAEMLEAAGAEEITRNEDMSPPGLAIHEVGTARMGDDAGTNVLNKWQQAHDAGNLFVMDGSGFPSSACQNPTLTMMALASRSCDYLIEEYRAGRT